MGGRVGVSASVSAATSVTAGMCRSCSAGEGAGERPTSISRARVWPRRFLAPSHAKATCYHHAGSSSISITPDCAAIPARICMLYRQVERLAECELGFSDAAGVASWGVARVLLALLASLRMPVRCPLLPEDSALSEALHPSPQRPPTAGRKEKHGKVSIPSGKYVALETGIVTHCRTAPCRISGPVLLSP